MDPNAALNSIKYLLKRYAYKGGDTMSADDASRFERRFDHPQLQQRVGGGVLSAVRPRREEQEDPPVDHGSAAREATRSGGARDRNN